MKGLIVILCLILLHTQAIFAQNHEKKCTPVDLRQGNIAPVRSQLYLNDGELKDSRFCYAFTLANLIGQRLGKPISPESIGVEYAISWPEQGNRFPLHMGYGGDIPDVLSSTLKHGNYCTVNEFSSYLKSEQMEKWYLLLHNKANPSEFLQFKKEFKEKCNGGVDKPFKELTFQAFENYKNKYPYAPPHMEPEELIKQIDSQLKSGNMVALTYDNHYVTIAGRTEECNYIIQDSIPHSYRKAHQFRNFYHKTQSEHIQLWTKDSLRKVFIPFNDFDNEINNSRPGIGFFEDSK